MPGLKYVRIFSQSRAGILSKKHRESVLETFYQLRLTKSVGLSQLPRLAVHHHSVMFVCAVGRSRQNAADRIDLCVQTGQENRQLFLPDGRLLHSAQGHAASGFKYPQARDEQQRLNARDLIRVCRYERAYRLVERSLLIVLNAVLISALRCFMEVTAPKAIRAATSAYSTRS